MDLEFAPEVMRALKSIFLDTPEDLERGKEYAVRVGKIVGAQKHPNEAVSMARSETGSHESTWLQARRLMEKQKPTPEERELVRKAFSHLRDGPVS